ncbi:MAG: SpoOM protein [Solirubrobacteraceae bacterium]|nr:SpoOM protein [Solirubrobacteraceae bacterium]
MGDGATVQLQTSKNSYLLGEDVEVSITSESAIDDLHVALVCRAPWLDDQGNVTEPWEAATEYMLTERVLASTHLSREELASAEGQVRLRAPESGPPGARGAIDWSVRAGADSGSEETAEILVLAPRAAFADDLEHVAPALNSSPEVSVNLGTDTVRAGDSLSGVVTVTPEKKLKARAVSVALVNTFMLATQLHSPERLELARDVEIESGQRHELPFTIPVPADVPPSFSDRNSDHELLPEAIRVPANYWEVRATVKAGRLFGRRSTAVPVHVFNG